MKRPKQPLKKRLNVRFVNLSTGKMATGKNAVDAMMKRLGYRDNG